MYTEQSHRYDEKLNVWYPNQYSSYDEYKQKYLELAYTTQLLCKRLKLLILYSKLKGEEAEYLKDDLCLNTEALHARATEETLKNIQCGLINLNGVEYSVTLIDVIRDRGLCDIYSISESNLKMHIMSICEIISERLTNGIYDSKFVTDIGDLIFKFNQIAPIYGSEKFVNLIKILDSIKTSNESTELD